MTTLDITERRPARARLLDLGLMRFEFLRVLRNKQSIAFTLVFPIAMFLFISSSIPQKSQKLGADMTANVSASVMVNMAPTARSWPRRARVRRSPSSVTSDGVVSCASRHCGP